MARQFPWHWYLGLALMLIGEATMLFDWASLYYWNFSILWFGYILAVDALVERLSDRSPIKEHGVRFLMLIPVSAVLWWIFEWLNLLVSNWYYIHPIQHVMLEILVKSLSFATVLPAVFETYWLFEAMHLFGERHWKRRKILSRPLILVGLGGLCLLFPWLFPRYAFPLIWIAFILILDPINYLRGEPSLLVRWKSGDRPFLLRLMSAGLVCGLFWEFWNFWAPLKWVYTIPIVDFLHVFEMPLLGYLGYPPFALELFAMYVFLTSWTPGLKRLRIEF